jgi:hypothetical protein
MLAFLLFASLSVHTNFDGGNIGKCDPVTPTHLRCEVSGQVDQDGRNRQANWYFFRVAGVNGRDITVDLEKLPGEYNYKPNRGAVTKDTVPLYRLDNGPWKHFETTGYDAALPRLRVVVKGARSEFAIAHVEPYTEEHLSRLLAGFRSHPHLRRTVIGKSVKGRELIQLTITDPAVPAASKRVIWLMTRQHAWESGSSLAGDGAIRFLLSVDPAAAAIRRETVFHVLPLCDPDGVASGGVRFNANGYDLNRNWDLEDEARMPEIAAQR